MRQESFAGQAIYGPLSLRVYDAYVLGLSNALVWRCPTRRLLAHYDRHVSAVHLDVGVGSGYYLDHCRFPVRTPEITLLDLNENSLSHCATRIARYGPRTVVGDVLEPIPLPHDTFASIAATYLLHCLPGRVEDGKWRAVDHLAPLLQEDGVFFGATILGAGLPMNRAQRALMGVYNRKGIFGNAEDTLEDLRGALSARFQEVEIEVVGVVAVFSARRRVST